MSHGITIFYSVLNSMCRRVAGTELLHESKLLHLARRRSGQIVCMVESHAFRDLEPREFGAAGCQHIGLGERGPRSRNDDDTADLALAFVGQPDREGLTDCVVSGQEIFNLLGPRRRSWGMMIASRSSKLRTLTIGVTGNWVTVSQ
jgi:hypothetical protein